MARSPNRISINFKTGKGSARGAAACRALLAGLGVTLPPKDPPKEADAAKPIEPTKD